MATAGKPKIPFYLVLAGVVIALVFFAVTRSDLFAPEGGGKSGGDIDPSKVGGGKYEAPDAQGVTHNNHLNSG